MSPVQESQRGGKGKSDGIFTHTGRDYIPLGFFNFTKGRAKKKNDLSSAMLSHVLTRTKEAWEGLLTGQLKNRKCDE